MSLRADGLKFHKFIASSKLITKLYLRFLSLIFKRFPDNLFKRQLMNSLRLTQWSEVDLPVQHTKIGGIPIKIVPHFNEYDFESLLMQDLNYEEEIFSYLKTSGRAYDAIIEIGANVGIYTLFFASFFKKSKIFSFEPSQKAYSRLLINMSLNQLSNVYVFNVAIGNKTTFINFYEPKNHLSNGSFDKKFASIFSQEVDTNNILMIEGTLIEFLIETHDKVLLKIDAEGSEGMILENLKRCIHSKKPDILVECLDIFEKDLNNLNLSEYYSFFQLTKCGPILKERFESGATRDYILIPKDSTALLGNPPR